MKTFFKVLSCIGLVLTSVVFGFVFYGERTIPNTIHLIENEKISVSEIYTLKVAQMNDSALPVELNKTISQFSLDKPYSVQVSLFKTIPVKSTDVTVSKRKYVVPSGDVFGIKLFTKGVLVVGLDDVLTQDGAKNPAKECGVQVGDILLRINGTPILRVSDVIRFLSNNTGQTILITVYRKGKEIELRITPVQSQNDQKFKLGLWLRDSTAGVGTITFIDRATGAFGSLGHAVCDIDSGTIMPLGEGEAVKTIIGGCYKGSNGVTGELCGVFQDKKLGELWGNTPTGVYGGLSKVPAEEQIVPVATRQEVKPGDAEIITTVDDTGPHRYNVKIIKILQNSNMTSKNFILEIVDPELIAKTGGIVQGMSGSPILQNDMLVGAVTHVFVNNPLQGYGVFAETMLETLNKCERAEKSEAA